MGYEYDIKAIGLSIWEIIFLASHFSQWQRNWNTKNVIQSMGKFITKVFNNYNNLTNS